MKLTIIALILSSATFFTTATLNGHCSGSSHSLGICLHTSTCTANGGSYVSGACPNDPPDVKCCTINDCIDSSSFCDWTGPNSDCAGIPQAVFVTGHCPGPSNFQCCNFGA